MRTLCAVVAALLVAAIAADGSDRRQGSGAFFDEIASTYDLLNSIISLGLDNTWRRHAIRSLDLRHGPVLDVSTGTADVAVLIAQMHDGVNVVGVDPSERMLAIGREKAAQMDLSKRVELAQGVAEDLSRYPDGTFEGATVAFGVRNFQDRPAGLREIARVLKPKARLAILELTGADPKSSSILSFPRELFISRAMPFIGGLVSGNFAAYRYLHESSSAFPTSAEFDEMLTSCGFQVLDSRGMPPFGLGPQLILAERA